MSRRNPRTAGPTVRISFTPAVSQVRTAIARHGTSHSSAEAALGAILHRGTEGSNSADLRNDSSGCPDDAGGGDVQTQRARADRLIPTQ
jgi:hypothetical protein